MAAADLTAEVERLIDRVFVAAPGASLRREERKKAVEVAALLGELARITRGRALSVVDAAAGKSYVGLFAAALVLDAGARVVAIEREPRRAGLAAAAAEALGVRVDVRVGDVGDAALWPRPIDVVVALHACGPAADLVIDRAMASEARHVLLVPCCTSEAVAAMPAAHAAALRAGIPRQAPVRRRFLQAFVDSERTLRLEAAGYETEVVELVAPTVTPHNLLWRARRVGEAGRMARAQGDRTRLLGG